MPKRLTDQEILNEEIIKLRELKTKSKFEPKVIGQVARSNVILTSSKIIRPDFEFVGGELSIEEKFKKIRIAKLMEEER